MDKLVVSDISTQVVDEWRKLPMVALDDMARTIDDCPAVLATALMTNRVELLQLAGSMFKDMEHGDKLLEIIGVLMQTRTELANHAKALGSMLDDLQGVVQQMNEMPALQAAQELRMLPLAIGRLRDYALVQFRPSNGQYVPVSAS